MNHENDYKVLVWLHGGREIQRITDRTKTRNISTAFWSDGMFWPTSGSGSGVPQQQDMVSPGIHLQSISEGHGTNREYDASHRDFTIWEDKNLKMTHKGIIKTTTSQTASKPPWNHPHENWTNWIFLFRVPNLKFDWEKEQNGSNFPLWAKTVCKEIQWLKI